MEPDPSLADRSQIADPQVAGLLAAVGEPSAGDAALAYAEAGMAVFPCAPDGKRPLTRHGLLDATCDRGVVARWWRGWPDANVGLATGARVEVVDVDRRPAGAGFVALERARTAGLTDGWAGIVRTPSQGLHLYYPTRSGRTQRSWAEPGAPASRTTARGVDGHRLATWVASRGEGNRNHALFWAACRYAEQHLPEERAHQLLGAAARHAGLPEREVVATIRSAYRTASQPAGSGPARTAVGPDRHDARSSTWKLTATGPTADAPHRRRTSPTPPPQRR